MSETQKIIRVFIGSPGGLDEERQAAHEAANSVNRSHSDHWGLQIRLLGWETAVPGFIRPQDKINEDLDRCDYFIGVVWNHWGSTPTLDPKGPKSGFEEEYKRAEARISSGFMKDMALYFKKVAIPTGFIPNTSMQKVIDFRTRCVAEKRHFFKDFQEASEFRELVREKLEEIGWRETEILQSERRSADQSDSVAPDNEKLDSTANGTALLFSGASREFLNSLMQRSSDWESTSATEIARLRLLGSAVKRSGNDDYYIGTHDANLLFQHFRHEEMSRREIYALIDCGVVGFQHQNVPLWTWIVREEIQTHGLDRVSLLAAVGTNAEKIQALNILGLVNGKVPSLEFYDKEKVLRGWLAEGVDSQVFDAAIQFLAEHADVEELQLLEEIAAESSPYHRVGIEAGIVGILSRINLNAALERVVESEVDKIDTNLANSLFISPQSIATDTAVRCLSAKPDSIRLRAAGILAGRDGIDLVTAETLLTDSNHEVRLIAAETLRKRGRPLQDEVAKKALRIVKSSFGLFGLTQNHTDDTFYERYLSGALSQFSYEDLFEQMETGSLSSTRVLSVLLDQHSKKAMAFLTRNLEDRFRTYVERRIQRDIAAGLITDDVLRDLRATEGLITNRMCSLALIAFTKHADQTQLNLVRAVLDGATIEADQSIIRYLGKYGDWSDINRVANLGDQGRRTRSLLEITKPNLPEQKASAILRIGKSRIADTLALDVDSAIRINIAKQLPKSALASLRDEILIRECERPVDDYRKAFALRCVQALPKSRLTTVLSRYIGSTDHRYYNSVHCLDLGVAMPTITARQIAEKLLSRI